MIIGQSPSFIKDHLVPVSEMQGRKRLRSAAAGIYNVPFTRTQFVRRAFSVAAISEWNSLPINIRQIADIRQFKRALKLITSPTRITRKYLIKHFSFIILLLTVFPVKRRRSLGVKEALYKLV